ncbi:uncharacterized protein GGS22DRAFT_89202 [Annulohypoxylon maeteangense]|uniref:uncharacterized protein n=1 Tax=Annulohypoxylon maeteangense TaxID=1927788 RepID=UPI002008D6FF|nr:uncharacterized protein GGS22DRAFT_89202 [Annulohypoxylon maeteangense]KAI0887794.1 hypothetical protein GGS22DRAFT_89202 [Annulohypoxylon maeteangense]
MQALTTVFTASSWCANRYEVYIDNNPYHSSTLSPSSGWVDPSFSKCVPSQYTARFQMISPGVCPGYMTMARTTSNVDGSKTLWTGGCCQSGFTGMPEYFCNSMVSTPMAFLLQPNISTADIYTTLSNMWIGHDQITIAWQETDLELLPKEVATKYASIMGIALTTTTRESDSGSFVLTHTTYSASEKTSSTIVTTTTSTTPTTTISVTPITDTTSGSITGTAVTSASTSRHASSTTSDAGSAHPRWIVLPLITGLALLWIVR